jgi:hypothetical protein
MYREKTIIRDFYSKKTSGKVLRRSRFYEKSGFQELYPIQEIPKIKVEWGTRIRQKSI